MDQEAKIARLRTQLDECVGMLIRLKGCGFPGDKRAAEKVILAATRMLDETAPTAPTTIKNKPEIGSK